MDQIEMVNRPGVHPTKNTHRPRPGRAFVAGLALVGLVAAGCGDDDGGSAGDASPAEVEVVGVEFAFQGLPERVDVGTKLTFRNDSSVEVHELVVVRLVDGEDRSIEELLELPEEEADLAFVPGPPVMVIVAAPGEVGTAVIGDGTLTEPGRYVVICAIPTGADPDEFMAAAAEGGDGPPEVDGGPPHFVHGMVGELRVGPEA